MNLNDQQKEDFDHKVIYFGLLYSYIYWRKLSDLDPNAKTITQWLETKYEPTSFNLKTWDDVYDAFKGLSESVSC